MKKVHFYSFLPFLQDASGHIYEYNLSVQKAALYNHWNYTAFVPKKTQFTVLPNNWHKKLPKVDFHVTSPTFFQRFKVCLFSFFPFKRRVQEMKEENCILFLEHFLFFHLIPLAFSLLFRKKKLELWLLYRYLPSSKKALFCRVFHAFFRKVLGKNHFKILTDSELLQKEQEKAFQQKVFLVPIPHGKISAKKSKPKQKELTLWWPGGQLREAKGAKEVPAIAKEIQKEKNHTIHLKLAKSGSKYFSNPSPFLHYLENAMSRKEYENQLVQADIVLLPYCPKIYKHSTSGILIETLIAGSIPVVKSGSWLSYELEKLNLPELILDWEKPVLPQLYTLLKSPDLSEKIRRAGEKLSTYHSVESLAKTFQEIEKSPL